MFLKILIFLSHGLITQFFYRLINQCSTWNEVGNRNFLDTIVYKNWICSFKIKSQKNKTLNWKDRLSSLWYSSKSANYIEIKRKRRYETRKISQTSRLCKQTSHPFYQFAYDNGSERYVMREFKCGWMQFWTEIRCLKQNVFVVSETLEREASIKWRGEIHNSSKWYRPVHKLSLYQLASFRSRTHQLIKLSTN